MARLENVRWEPEHIITLISAYQGEECLYKTKHENYHNKTMRLDATRRVLVAVKEVRPATTADELNRKIHGIRNQFALEHKKVLNSQKSGCGTDSVYVPNLWYYKHLLFLADHFQPRKSTGTRIGSKENTCPESPGTQSQSLSRPSHDGQQRASLASQRVFSSASTQLSPSSSIRLPASTQMSPSSSFRSPPASTQMSPSSSFRSPASTQMSTSSFRSPGSTQMSTSSSFRSPASTQMSPSSSFRSPALTHTSSTSRPSRTSVAQPDHDYFDDRILPLSTSTQVSSPSSPSLLDCGEVSMCVEVRNSSQLSESILDPDATIFSQPSPPTRTMSPIIPPNPPSSPPLPVPRNSSPSPSLLSERDYTSDSSFRAPPLTPSAPRTPSTCSLPGKRRRRQSSLPNTSTDDTSGALLNLLKESIVVPPLPPVNIPDTPKDAIDSFASFAANVIRKLPQDEQIAVMTGFFQTLMSKASEHRIQL